MSVTFPSTALEDYIEGSQDLSDEEVAVIIDESDESARVLRNDLAQAQRLRDISDSLEGLAVVATRIERTTPAELRLLGAAADMAAAGTRICPQNFITVSEEFLGKAMAVEGFVDNAKKLVETILAHIAKIWGNIEDFLRLAFTIPATLSAIKARADQVGRLGIPGTPVVTIENSLNALRIEGTLPDKSGMFDYAKLEHAMDEFAAASEYVYDDYLVYLAKVMKNLGDRISVTSIKNSIVVAEDLVKDMDKLILPMPPKHVSTKGTKDDDLYIVRTRSQTLLGDMVLVHENPQPDKGNDDLDKLRAIRRRAVKFEYDENTAAMDPSTEFIQMKILDPKEIKEVLTFCHKLLNKMSAFYVGREYSSLRSIRLELGADSKEAATRISTDEFPGSQAYTREYCEALTREILNMNLSCAMWMESPLVPMYRKSIAVVQTLVVMVDAHMRAYTVRKARM